MYYVIREIDTHGIKRYLRMEGTEFTVYIRYARLFKSVKKAEKKIAELGRGTAIAVDHNPTELYN